MKANKGEWCEFYAFLKILADKQLPAADKNLNPLANHCFIFKQVIRPDGQNRKIFDLNKSDIHILDAQGVCLKIVPDVVLKNQIAQIFEQIKNAHTTTFELPAAADLMQTLLCDKIKAGNAEKSDIEGVIFDPVSHAKTPLGFSIKSMVGGAATLLNAGKTTNFIYEITGLSAHKIADINAISGKAKIQNRLKSILKSGAHLNFTNVSNANFATNLRKIDTVFAQFIAQMLQDFFSGKANKLTELVTILAGNQALQNAFLLSKSDYEYKIKNFLAAAALGMVPGTIWDGFTKTHGGYIVVKNNGEVVCYHLYNRDEFLTYLFDNTKFESASSTRHDYGKIYQKHGKLYFNLNLQIRFLK